MPRPSGDIPVRIYRPKAMRRSRSYPTPRRRIRPLRRRSSISGRPESALGLPSPRRADRCRRFLRSRCAPTAAGEVVIGGRFVVGRALLGSWPACGQRLFIHKRAALIGASAPQAEARHPTPETGKLPDAGVAVHSRRIAAAVACLQRIRAGGLACEDRVRRSRLVRRSHDLPPRGLVLDHPSL